MLLLLVAGCATLRVSKSALCDGLEIPAKDHAKGLLEDGGDKSVITGATLLSGLKEGCGYT